ncbi:MAG: tetratricopeptide repeat protein [Desulfuromonadaceae bacterium]|nr:tetratricopeptide repeat protein [Desulfuromonadaceae bacterium]
MVKTSGGACSDQKNVYEIFLIIGDDGVDTPFFGYLGGNTVTVAQLKGSALDGTLTLRYPYSDPERAEGNTIKFEIEGPVLNGELRDRHLEATVKECNFDLARIKLVQSEDNFAATEIYQRLSLEYEAQLTRSKAMAITRTAATPEAVRLFEKALELADKLYSSQPARLYPYLTSLANAYMRTGQHQEFINLYKARINSINDEAVRNIFDHYQIRSLNQTGRAALGRGEYQAALDNFSQALQIDYKNKDSIAATMSALVRSGRHDEAITFLEKTELRLDSEPDRKDVREAIALVQYQKAKKEEKDGLALDALRDLRKAISLDPGTSYYLIALARWLHKTGQYSEADTVLKRGIELFKDDEPSSKDLIEAREKLRLTEIILAKIRRAGF